MTHKTLLENCKEILTLLLIENETVMTSGICKY